MKTETPILVAIAREKIAHNQFEWNVYLINNCSFPIENVLVTSKGYREKENKVQRIPTLRHFLDRVLSKSYILIEPIDSTVFTLTNEYWVSYYVENRIFGKKFIFHAHSFGEANITFIDELNLEGILQS